MADVFGVDKNVFGADRIVNGAGVLVSIDGPIYLVQSCNVSYARQITPIYELGSEDIYAGASNPSGTVQLSRIVGLGSEALITFKQDAACDGQTITIGNGDSCGDEFGTITAPDSMLQDVGLQAQAGQASVTENATYWAGTLEVS